MSNNQEIAVNAISEAKRCIDILPTLKRWGFLNTARL